MRFVLIRGAFGSPEGNWFPRLKQQLEGLGQTVVTPQLAVDDWDEVTKNGSTAPVEPYRFRFAPPVAPLSQTARS